MFTFYFQKTVKSLVSCIEGENAYEYCENNDPSHLYGFFDEKQTVWYGWKVKIRNCYTAIPVLDAEQHYIVCVSEGDFPRHILSTDSLQ